MSVDAHDQLAAPPDLAIFGEPASTARLVNPATAYLEGLQASGSRRVQRTALATIARLANGGDPEAFPWWRLRRHHTHAIRTGLAKRLAPNTVNRHLAALRQVLAEAARLRDPQGEHLLSAEDYRDAVDVPNLKRRGLLAGREVTPVELAQLFAACAADGALRGTRDAAILATIYGGGLRRSELVALELASVKALSLEIRHGKGDKDRVVHLPELTMTAIGEWLALRGREAGPLFDGLTIAGERRPGERLSAEGVRVLLISLAERAGVEPFTPHDLRRSYVTHALDAGADIFAVQLQVGHSSPATTQRYDRRGERAQAAAAVLLKVPFLPRTTTPR